MLRTIPAKLENHNKRKAPPWKPGRRDLCRGCLASTLNHVGGEELVDLLGIEDVIVPGDLDEALVDEGLDLVVACAPDTKFPEVLLDALVRPDSVDGVFASCEMMGNGEALDVLRHFFGARFPRIPEVWARKDTRVNLRGLRLHQISSI